MKATIDGVDTTTKEYISKTDYDIYGNPVYVGKAMIGSSASASAWQIKKIVYDINFNITDVQYANSSETFDKIWNNRTSYIYG